MPFMMLLAFIFAKCSLLEASPRKPVLDTAHIHKTYLDGDFDLAIEYIEDARKYGGPFTHEDSVFIFKHLGVMYTAKYETREKGKRYLVQLLHVEPTAKILDMYASDMIYMIFKNIKDEFDAKHARFTDSDAIRNPKPGPKQETAKTPLNSHAWVGWTAGAIAAAGGIALAFHLLDEEPKRQVNQEVVR